MKKQNSGCQKSTVHLPFQLVKNIKKSKTGFHIELNEKKNIQIQIQGNQKWKQLSFIQTQTTFYQKQKSQVFQKKKQQSKIIEEEDWILEEESDNQKKGTSSSRKSDILKKSADYSNFQQKWAQTKVFRIRFSNFNFHSSTSPFQKITQDDFSAQKEQNTQNKLRKHVFSYEVCTREEQRKFIAFILTHNQFLQGEGLKLRINLLSNYVPKAKSWALIKRYHSYLEKYPGITPFQIAQKSRIQAEFTHEEIQAQVQKILQTKTSYDTFFATKCRIQTDFSDRIKEFKLHEFFQESVKFSPSDHYSQIKCKSISYRFLPCLKSKCDPKIWKVYQLFFEIELQIPSIHIKSQFEDETDVNDQQNEEKPIKGFWISINGGQRKYHSKQDVIDRMRILDLNNKLQQIEIIEQLLGIKDKAGQNQKLKRQKEKSPKIKVEKKCKKISINKQTTKKQSLSECEDESAVFQKSSKPQNKRKIIRKVIQKKRNKKNPAQDKKPLPNQSGEFQESEDESSLSQKGLKSKLKGKLIKKPLLKRKNLLISNRGILSEQSSNNIQKSQNWTWTYQQTLRLFEFITLYSPLVSQFPQMRSKVRSYFKIAEQYVKSKDFNQCYGRYLRFIQEKSSFDKLLSKELLVFKLNKQEVIDTARFRIHDLIKSGPIVVNDKLMQSKKFEIKSKLNEKTDEEIRILTKEHLEKLKFDILIKDDFLSYNQNQDSSQNVEGNAKKYSAKPKSTTTNLLNMSQRDIETRVIFEHMEKHKFQQVKSNKILQLNFNFCIHIKSKK